MAGLHSQKSNTESVSSSVDGDGSDDEYDLYDYYNEGLSLLSLRGPHVSMSLCEFQMTYLKLKKNETKLWLEKTWSITSSLV